MQFKRIFYYLPFSPKYIIIYASYQNYFVLDKGGTHVRFFWGEEAPVWGGADAPKWVLQFKSHVCTYKYICTILYYTCI